MKSKQKPGSSKKQRVDRASKLSEAEQESQSSRSDSCETDEQDLLDQGILTDYIPQSLTATHTNLYPDMDFGAIGRYVLDGVHPVAGNRVKKRHRMTASIITPGAVDIQDVLEQDEILVHLSGRFGNDLFGTGGFHIKSSAPGCTIEIKLKGTSFTTGPLVVDSAP